MTEEKRNRLIAAVTVNVILLIAILAAVCIYQIVEMVTLKNLEKELQKQIEYYETKTEENENTLEYFKTQQGLEDLAYQWYKYPENNNK